MQAYQEQVLAARQAGKPISLIPKRTDITPDEYDEIMSAPIDEVKNYTLNVELADYAESIAEIGLAATIDNINEEMSSGDAEAPDAAPPRKSRKKKTDLAEKAND